MREDESNALQACYDKIVNCVQEHNILPRLVADFILTPQDVDTITAEKTMQQKMMRFVNFDQPQCMLTKNLYAKISNFS